MYIYIYIYIYIGNKKNNAFESKNALMKVES